MKSVMVGDVFGRLTVISPSTFPNRKGNKKWLCRCSCGVEKEILHFNLLSNRSNSCGCVKRENMRNWYNKYKKETK